MPGKQAKIVNDAMLRQMLQYAETTTTPERDQVMILLSVKAGMRAVEIAGLTWPMVLTPRGGISDTIAIRDAIAKKNSGRIVPMHALLRQGLVRLALKSETNGAVIRSHRGGHMLPNSIVNWFVALYGTLGFEGCSSHSGRRTFITAAARNLHKAGCSLRDVQLLAGHRSIETTQRYIDADTNGQRRLVSLL